MTTRHREIIKPVGDGTTLTIRPSTGGTITLRYRLKLRADGSVRGLAAIFSGDVERADYADQVPTHREGKDEG